MQSFHQSKLTKMEWEGIEVPLPKEELDILNLIKNGWKNSNIVKNNTDTIFNYSKIQPTKENHNYLFLKYLKHMCHSDFTVKKLKSEPKKADIIRMKSINVNNTYEYVLLNCIKNFKDQLEYNYYSLIQLLKFNITNVNIHVIEYCKFYLNKFSISYTKLLENSRDILENNEYIRKYKDIRLYDHQKDIFEYFKSDNNKLVLYSSPTGSGKTLTPIGLSEKYKIIFICGARHVSLALARAAISADKKIGLAFNCTTADDIRLHYSAAKEFIVDRRSGGIRKVDNSNGEKCRNYDL